MSLCTSSSLLLKPSLFFQLLPSNLQSIPLLFMAMSQLQMEMKNLPFEWSYFGVEDRAPKQEAYENKIDPNKIYM